MILPSDPARWSQVVRTAGRIRVLGHHQVDVPAMGTEPPGGPSRPGVRLLTQPLPGGPDHYTIDVTSTATLAMLEAFLATGLLADRELHWRARGFGRHRRDTISITGVR